MTLEKHSFLSEFPDHHHTIRHLKMHDRHFAKLFDEYNDLDHEVFSLESAGIPTTDDNLEQKKCAVFSLKTRCLPWLKKKKPRNNTKPNNLINHSYV
ncbi:YdcH family protein [Alishewanella sp. HL-SH05]|uniref:YdcH family protein n=1 Tax=Alishewanella sp. HL-SH05 TaxID=3461145 RepID=UPI0040414057